MAKKARAAKAAPSPAAEAGPDLSRMRIVYEPLSSVARWPRNPKLHDAKSLDDSIERFGYCDPITIDEGTGHLVEGHGRIEALQRRKEAGDPPPARIVEEGDEWLVPVVRGVSFRDELEAEAYVVAHNKISEAGGWDNFALVEVLRAQRDAGAGLAGTGWKDDEVGKLEKMFRRDDIPPPDFAPAAEDEQGRLDKKDPIACPECGHEFVPPKR